MPEAWFWGKARAPGWTAGTLAYDWFLESRAERAGENRGATRRSPY